MTRIVAGTAGGRRLRVPPKGTRPTSDRVREALFSALEAGGDIADARVLDLYAGSGALGLEALSRGAADAWFVEADRRAADVLRANVAAVGLGGTVHHGKVAAVLSRFTPEPFELVLADPPYAVTDDDLRSVLQSLANGWLTDGALVVVERGVRGGVDWPDAYRPLRVKTYGDTALHWAEFGTVGT